MAAYFETTAQFCFGLLVGPDLILSWLFRGLALWLAASLALSLHDGRRFERLDRPFPPNDLSLSKPSGLSFVNTFLNHHE